MPLAVSIELLHNAFLIHDDIADGSEQRRGKPTLPESAGLAIALERRRRAGRVRQPGDAARRYATSIATSPNGSTPSSTPWRCAPSKGQATELGWRRDRTVDLTAEDYLDLIMHKTCWYTTIHPLRVGALIGVRGRVDLRPMVRFGFHLGAAFQIQDDVLNLIGDEEEYGKEINGDLYEGKRTLPLIHLMSHAERRRPRDRRRVPRHDPRRAHAPVIVGDPFADGHVRQHRLHGRLRPAASRAKRSTHSRRRLPSAEPGPDRDFIRDLIPYMLNRRS